MCFYTIIDGTQVHINGNPDDETMTAITKMVKLARTKLKQNNMYDNAIGHLREARAALLEEKENGKNSRELAVALTEIDTAILWRQDDLRLKEPPRNEVGRKGNLLDALVFPSEEKTITVEDDPIYGGAHHYLVQNSLGFSNGKAEYIPEGHVIQFVQKNDDGSMIPGLQSEQLALSRNES